MKKNILGLDLGTNSIGWALINIDKEEKKGEITALGSRIISMGAEVSNFEQGNPQTKNAYRRTARSIRRMCKRYKARRNKLLYILSQIIMLPEQFKFSTPFDNPLKIQKVNLLPVKKKTPQLTALELLQLKVKALSQKIELQDLGKIIFNYNQLRGYAGGGNDEEEEKIETTNESESENEENFKKSEKIIDSVKIISLPEGYGTKKEGNETQSKKQKPKFEITIELMNEKVDDEVNIICETTLENLKVNEILELELFVRRGSSKKNKGQVISTFLSLPIKTNWRKSMEELEEELDKLTEQKGSEGYLCEYFLKKLQEDKYYKLRNKVILRKRYLAEFNAIWDSQISLNP